MLRIEFTDPEVEAALLDLARVKRRQPGRVVVDLLREDLPRMRGMTLAGEAPEDGK